MKSKEETLREVHEALAMMNEYHATVGRLVLQWSEMEAALYRVLLYYGQIDTRVGRAMLSGTRAKPLMTYTRSIADNIGLDDVIVADLDWLFAQVATISDLRDRLVHFGRIGFRLGKSEFINPKQVLSNSERVARLKAAQAIHVDTEVLQSAFNDLVKIEERLLRHLDPPLHAEPRVSWLYKSLQPVIEVGESQKERRTRSAQPRPSPKSPRKGK